MNIGDLTKGVAEATGSTDADAKKAITAVFDQIANAAAKGEEVSIPPTDSYRAEKRTGKNRPVADNPRAQG